MTQSAPATQTVTVQILDKEYHVVCPVQERANLERAALYLDGKMRDIRRSGKVYGAERVAVLAALNITHELQSRQQQADVSLAQDQGQGEQVRELAERINQALAAD